MKVAKSVVGRVVKQVGASGQISLGKEFAGRTVVIECSEPGVWVIKTAQTIPDAELWLHQPKAAARLDRAMASMDTPAQAADLEALEQQGPALGADPEPPGACG